MHSLYPTFQFLEHEEILLSFKGKLGPDTIQNLISIFEKGVRKEEVDNSTVRKMLGVFIEAIQNAFHYAEPGPDETSSTIVVVRKNTGSFSIQTGNYIGVVKIPPLEGYLNELNKLNTLELKERYKEKLKNGIFSSKGTAGLGMIDMRRKSGNAVAFHFEPINAFYAFLSLQLTIQIDEYE
jgi:hypothetical protein